VGAAAGRDADTGRRLLEGLCKEQVELFLQVCRKKYNSKRMESASAVGAPKQFGLQCGWGAAERRHPTGRERMGSTTLQALSDPILLLPWVSFQGGGFP
jgi:hypothetical protein